MARLTLSLLGPFQAWLDGEPISGFTSNKVRALLVYLAVEAARPHARRALAALLWPDQPDSAALSALRHALSDLRGALGDRGAPMPLLLITRDTLQLNPAAGCRLDVAVFRQELSAISLSRAAAGDQAPTMESLQSAVALYRGPFLEGFSLADSSPFEEWALLKREELAQQALAALSALAAAHEAHGEYEEAIACARRQLELEPWLEEAHRQLMRALALSDRRSAALAQYEACRRTLAHELGVEPAPETTALFEAIRRGALPPAAAPAGRSQAGASPPAAAFVAREPELARLEQHLALALAGQPRVALVAGETGSGKTALLAEFARRAMERHTDLVVAGGSCNAHTGLGDPYLPFRDILGMLTACVEAQRAGGDISAEHARRLWELLPAALEALIDAGPGLVGLLVPAEGLLARAHALGPARLPRLGALEALVQRQATNPPSLQQADLYEQVCRVLGALAGRRPLLLLLDDLQWIDHGSLSLLFHLARRLPACRLLIVGAYRPADVAPGPGSERHPLPSLVNELQRSLGDIVVDLAEADGRRFIDAYLDRQPNGLGAAFRDTLYRHTGGQPLFTVELLSGLQERGDLRQDENGRWVEGAALAWDRLPPRVKAVVAERINRLPAAWRAALVTASVEGEEFTAEVVARVQGVSEEDAIAWLSGPLSSVQHLVRATSRARLGTQPLSRYRFRHALFQRYLYSQLDVVERARLHEAVGEALEALYGTRLGEVAVQPAG